MKLRIVVCLLTFLSLCGEAAFAQESAKVDIFAGYSYLRENPSTSGADSFSLNGGSASLAYHPWRISAATTTEIYWGPVWMAHSLHISLVLGFLTTAIGDLHHSRKRYSVWRMRELA